MPTERDGEAVLVGLIVRPHGLAGEVVVEPWSDAPERFRPGGVLDARPRDGVPRRLVVAGGRPFGARLLVRFEGVATRDDAEALRESELLIPRSEVAPLPPGRHYRFELVGLTVRDRAGAVLGRVTDVFATGSNDVIVVRGGERELLLPAIESVLLEVAPDRGELRVEVPPGLLDPE